MTSHCHYCGIHTDRIKQLEAELAKAEAVNKALEKEWLEAGQYMRHLEAQLARAK